MSLGFKRLKSIVLSNRMIKLQVENGNNILSRFY